MTKEPVRLPSSDSDTDEFERPVTTNTRASSANRRNAASRSAPAGRAAAARGDRLGLAAGLEGPAKLALAGLVGAMIGAGVYALAEHSHGKHPTPIAELPSVTAETKRAEAATPSPPAAAAEPGAAAPAADEAPSAAKAADTSAAKAAEEGESEAAEESPSEAASSAGNPRIGAEKALLQSARAKLRSGDSFGAQATLDQMKKRFPKGALSQERELLYIETQRALGATAAAKRSARAFAVAHPNSSHLPALEKLLLEP